MICVVNNKKNCEDCDILVKIIKEKVNIVLDICQNNFNKLLFSFIFSCDLKVENLAFVFFKQDRSSIENGRPISFYPDLSKN